MKKIALLNNFRVQVYFIALLILFIICYGSRVTKADDGCNLHQKKRTSYKKYARKHYKNIKIVSFYGKQVKDKVTTVNVQLATIEAVNPKFR